MCFKKVLAVAIIAIFGLSILPGVALAKGRPPDFVPIPAQDVQLVKKVSLKGPPSWAVAGGRGNREEGAATGALGSSCSGERYAIVIGISDYPGYSNDLEYADDDASSVRDALVNVYGFDSGDVFLRTDLDATATAIFSAIDTVRGLANDGDEVVFFFSGQGAKGRASDGDKEKMDEAIVAHNGSELVFIWDGLLKEWFSDFATSRIIFAFDTCLSGGMTDLSATGRVINMAATEKGYSYEGDAWGHGEFTYYFIVEGVSGGEADVHDHDDDGSLGESADVVVEEAFDYAKANCRYGRPIISDGFEDDLLP